MSAEVRPSTLIGRLRRWLGEPYYLSAVTGPIWVPSPLPDSYITSDSNLTLPHPWEGPALDLMGVQLLWTGGTPLPTVEVEQLYQLGGVICDFHRELSWAPHNQVHTLNATLNEPERVKSQGLCVTLRFTAPLPAQGRLFVAAQVRRRPPLQRLRDAWARRGARLHVSPFVAAAAVYYGLTDTDPIWRPFWFAVASFYALRALAPARLF